MAAVKKASTGKGPAKSNTVKKSSTGRAKTTKKGNGNRSGRKTTGKQHKRTAEEINTYKDQMAFETGITILVMLTVGMFFYLSFFGVCGKVGIVLSGLSFGLFGWLSWLLPLYIIVGYTFAIVNAGDKRVPRRLISSGIFLLSLGTLIELLFPKEILTEYYTSNHVLHHNFLECLYMSLRDVAKGGKGSGGIIGRAIGDACASIIGKWGAAALLFAVLLLCIYIFYGLEMMASLRKRNAYHQEMEEAYDQILEEEEYKEPSYRVVPNRKTVRKAVTKRTGTFQSVNLKEVGQKLDQMEAVQKTGEKASNHANTRKKKAEKITAPAGMQEIQSEGPEKGIKAAVLPPLEENPEPVGVLSEKQETCYTNDVSQIPIYREELNQKFGKAQKPMNSFAPKEEVTDVRPVSQIQKEMQEKESGNTTDTGNGSTAGAGRSTGEAKRKKNTTEHGRIGGKDSVSSSETFNALNDSKMEKEEIPYQFPPLDLLGLPQKAADRVSDEKLRETAARLQETLQSFNVNVQMGAVTCGPTVTRYEVLPEQGVRVNKITNLADDLKLSLAAANIRIEAPIPGKSAVGIEVPNEEPSSVHFRELLQGSAFEKAKSPVTFAVGKDIAGKIIVTDIAKMPHLLIAGATGSGKSVCINTLIMSILYKSDPNEVKLIMIDPKVVELSVYNGIPHLFCPVVTDPKEAAAALNWAVREMMDRYNKFKELGVRNIQGYNEKIKTVDNAAEAGYAKMPLLVIIVDEFADLMMVASKEVEDAVCRLAQLARAAGIHLILATQRPSVNVITGVIKANIPSRIAFSVSSTIDSRTILDKGGAEKLLGKGDMLFFPSGYSEPVRLQGAFVSDKEVSDVVDFLCSNNETPVYNDKVTEIIEPEPEAAAEEHTKPDRDEYFEEAGRFVIESERAAAGQLQRRFSIGFNRAGRIIDQLHKAGVVGPAVGTKPRQVLMTMEQFDNYLGLGGEDGTPVPEEEFAAVAEDFDGDL